MSLLVTVHTVLRNGETRVMPACKEGAIPECEWNS